MLLDPFGITSSVKIALECDWRGADRGGAWIGLIKGAVLKAVGGSPMQKAIW